MVEDGNDAAPPERRHGWSAAPLLGMPITLQPGSLLLVALVTALLAWNVLPNGVPGAGLIDYWISGFIVAALFVASVLAHEYGHALAARRRGMHAAGIRVSLLGGVTDLTGRLPNPTSAWQIAAAGPAVTLLLGAVFYGVALLADSGSATLIGMGATWLAFSNLVIGALNLLPAAPFDGGHILSAALWRWSGDQDHAEHLAARAGQVLGLILLGAAIVQVVTGGITGIWVGLLGAFMLISATSAGRQDLRLTTTSPGRADDGLVRHRQVPVVGSG